MSDTSYIGKNFTVSDSDARLRDANDIMTFLTGANGKPLTIAQGTVVRVTAVNIFPRGARSILLFADVTRASDGQRLGWTAASNIRGGLVSETLGRIAAPAGGNKFGAHAVWENGQYLGQTDLVRVMGSENELEFLAPATAERFVAMVAAAQGDGIAIAINSGFRSYPEQKHLREGWEKKLPKFNAANKPGYSNHQNGLAVDLSVGVGPGNPAYDWLAKHGTSFGFLRTVKKEVWHWECRPAKATAAKAAGKHKNW